MITRILNIVGNMNMGGQETFIMNLYRNIDREKYQFDFVVHSEKRGFYDDEIEKLGGKIYRITPMSSNLIKHCKELYRILKENNYIVHRHTCSSIVAFDCLVARLAKVKKIIVHCHATQATNHSILNFLFRPLMNKLSDVKLSCSKSAGIFLYGKYSKFKIINNAIDIEKFVSNEDIRKEQRKKHEAENKYIIGHVGRFDKVKNHTFILDVFEKIKDKDNDNVELWLIGDGVLKQEIEELAKKKGIYDKIKFFATQNNVNEILMAMDTFIFPSIYEGLGIALIEAQISGLTCTVSDRIQEEAIITNNVKVLNLESPIEEWVNEVLNKPNNDRRIDIQDKKIQNYKMENLVEAIYKVYSDNRI